METGKAVALGVVGLVVIGGVIYFISRGNKAAAQVSAASGGMMPDTTSMDTSGATGNTFVDANDKAYYDKVKSVYEQKMGKPVDLYYLQQALQFFQNGDLRSPDYLINGKPTRTGALMSAIATSYQDSTKGVDKDTNEATWSVFQEFRKKELAL